MTSTARGGSLPGEILNLPSATVRMLGHLDTIHSQGVRPIRLPRKYWSRFAPTSEFLRSAVCSPSGVRLLMRTRASTIRIQVRCTRIDADTNVGPVNSFVAEVGGQVVARAAASVDATEVIALSGATRKSASIREHSVIELGPLGAGEKDVVVWLPQGMVVDIIDITADEPIAAGLPPQRPVWVHHGSSISHCTSPTSPTSAWPVIAAGLSDLELVNLGFGGNCMLDPFVADAIAETPADVFTLKVGVNIVGARSLDQRTFVPALHGFLDRVRQGHPNIPMLVCSSILWPGSETTPGPGDVELFSDGRVRCFTAGDPQDVAKGALTMEESRKELAHAVAVRQSEGDNIVYLDGLALYGPQDVHSFVMLDSLHPEADLYEEMGRRFARLVFGENGLLPRSALR